MIEMSLSEAAATINGTLSGENRRFSGCSTDSRMIDRGQLFIALRGARFDGHDFLEQAWKRGAGGALVERASGTGALSLVRVQNSLQAMGELASAWRARFEIPVVAVTGSNGKTTVKDMVTSILAQQAPVHATHGNFNNEIGVPLTLFGLGREHRYLVVEMGANHHGEISRLSRMSRPRVAVITQCAPAHLEGFGSVEGVATAKAEIFDGLGGGGTAVLNADDGFLELWRASAGPCRQITFGLGDGAQVRASAIHPMPEVAKIAFRMVTPSGRTEVTLSLPGTHNVMNALAAAACAEALGIPVPVIRAGLEAVRPVKGRLQLKGGARSCRILDDSYNANPASLAAALAVLQQVPGRHWLVLGDMGELGESASTYHFEAGERARESGVERLYGVGPLSRMAAQGFGEGGRYFQTVEELNPVLRAEIRDGVTILVKGSRAMAMERVVGALMRED